MLSIGIIGGKEVYRTREMLCELYSLNPQFAKNENVNVYAFDILSDSAIALPSHLDLLVISGSEGLKDFMNMGISFKQAIVNSDIKDIYKHLKGFEGSIISYGLNGKACVTASSIMEGNAVFSIQRAIETLNGKTLMQQDFPVKIEFSSEELDSLLGAVTTAITQGLDIV